LVSQNNDYGTIGIAWLQTTCFSNRYYRTSLNEYFFTDLATAEVRQIWTKFPRNIRGKSLGHKTKQPLFHLGILRNVNNFYKIVDIFQIFCIFFSTKKWEIMLLNYFHEYAILLHLNFSVLTVDWARPLSVKRSGGRVEGGSTISEK
jgi:hypothetical protein